MSDSSHDNPQTRTAAFYVAVFFSYWVIGATMGYLSQFVFLEEGIKRVFASINAPVVAQWLYAGVSADAFGAAAPHSRDDLPAEGAPRAPITVALVTDDDLQAYHATYPLPYGFHAERLDSIASHRPKAIFIDIAFLDARPDDTLPELIGVLCHIRKRQGIPVFLASLDYAGMPLRPELEKAAGEGCFEKVAVPRQLDRYDRHNWEYVLQEQLGNARSDSPALALYKTLQPAAGTLAGREAPANLGLLWGMEPHAYNPLRMRREDGTPLCRSEWRWYREIPLLSSLLPLSPLADAEYDSRRSLPFCPYHASFPMHFLSAKGEVAHRLIEDRVVMYGVDLQSVGDYSFSPLHGGLPGVFVHAMALDNLLAFKGDYPRALDFQLHLDAGLGFPLLMVTLAALIAMLLHWQHDHGCPWIRKLLAGGKSHVADPAKRLKPPATALAKKILESVRAGEQTRLLRWRRMAGLVALDFLGQLAKLALLPFVLLASWLLLLLVGWVGVHVFKLGMLSWIEYAVIPMVLESLHAGDGLAKYLYGLWRAGFHDGWAAEHGLHEAPGESPLSQTLQGDVT